MSPGPVYELGETVYYIKCIGEGKVTVDSFDVDLYLNSELKEELAYTSTYKFVHPLQQCYIEDGLFKTYDEAVSFAKKCAACFNTDYIEDEYEGDVL